MKRAIYSIIVIRYHVIAHIIENKHIKVFPFSHTKTLVKIPIDMTQ